MTSLIIRGIGILFRIYMAAKIGAEGMGLYQMVFSVYTLAAAAGSGLPAAITGKLSAMPDDRSRMRPLFFSMGMAALTLGISAAVFFFSSDMVSISLLADGRTALSIKILCVSLPFMGMSACIKGYFIAENKTGTPSAAQLFEQLVRIAVIAVLLVKVQGMGLEYACAAVIFGDSMAEIFSFLFMFTALMINRRKKAAASAPGFSRREIIKASAPITGSRYLTTALRSAENIIIPLCLAAFSSSSQEAVARFGMLKGMAIPLLFFPASFLGALSTLLLPEVSQSYAAGRLANVRRLVGGAIGTTLFAAIPIMGVFLVFGRQLSQLIYASDGVGFIVVTLAPIVPFMYLESVCDGILKGMTQQAHSLLYNIIDSVIRIAAIYILVPRYGMEAFLGIMIFSNILTSSLNIRRLLKVSGMSIPIRKYIILPLVITAAACLAGKAAEQLLGGGLLFIGGIAVTAAVYMIISIMTWKKGLSPLPLKMKDLSGNREKQYKGNPA